MTALVGAVVLAVSAAVSFAAPQVKAANGPCDTGDWSYAYINVRKVRCCSHQKALIP